MSYLNNSQLLIFGSTFLVVSIIANGILLQENISKGKQFDNQNRNLENVQEALTEKDLITSTQVARLDTMNGQQEELASYIQQLQDQLTLLKDEYQQNLETATLSMTHLKQATDQINQLDTKLHRTTAANIEYEKTISNQQRLIRKLQADSAQSTSAESTLWQANLSSLSLALTPISDQINITVAGTGEGVIDIPQSVIFNDNKLTISAQAGAIIENIIAILADYPAANIHVIGHADARPIVSDFSKLYPTNWELSSARASKVVQEFIKLGTEPQMLLASGKSAGQPIRDDANETAWQINRRIEIRIQP